MSEKMRFLCLLLGGIGGIILLCSIGVCRVPTYEHEIPHYERLAYINGPIAVGTIANIDLYPEHNAWSGHKTYYRIKLNTGVLFELEAWEYRRAKYPQIGENITVYYSWQGGMFIKRN